MEILPTISRFTESRNLRKKSKKMRKEKNLKKKKSKIKTSVFKLI
tara:strand:+ start:723 stop:857 length:135 start_codon:yes stop_codon:yes gene_type:complete